MERKTLLAIGLMLIVAILPSILFPGNRRAPGLAGDSLATFDSLSAAIDTPDVRQPVQAAAEPPAPEPAAAPAPGDVGLGAAPETEVLVTSPLYRLSFSSRGARLVSADLSVYRTFVTGDSGRANVLPPESRFLEYRMVMGSDTIDLSSWNFTPSAEHLSVEGPGSRLTWEARRGPAVATIEYTFDPDHYMFDVNGRIDGLGGGSGFLLIGMGPRLARTEKDSVADARAYAFTTGDGSSVDKLKYSSLDPGETRALSGPFEWVAIKSKYFLTALLTVQEGIPRMGGALATGGPREGRTATDMDVRVSLPAPGATFSHSVYVGPQEFRRLAAIGHEFEDVNPYGGFIGPLVNPFAKIVVRILIWMHENLSLAYGWVLVLFGIGIRLLLWPINQKAMKSSIAMQAIQPQMKALQTKHKDNPQLLQKEMMELYREHGVNPLGGCLPSLIPMPVLFALFFVFQNTIELRGVSFMWLPDLSGADPLFITPVVMAVSMWALFRIGQIGVPPNPQTKMMLYFMPVMFLFFGIKFPSGLNLYYMVSNIASLPQQWMIAQKRLKKAAARGDT